MRDSLTVGFVHTGDSEEVRQKLEALANGVVELNVIELGMFPNFRGLAAHKIAYEEPRMGKEGQKIGSLSQVIKRKRATCIEAAAIEAAILRADDGVDARVVIVPEMYKGKPRPFRFHAVVQANGETIDSSQHLVGYAAVGGDGWWEGHGHCCEECALGHECLGQVGGCNCEIHED